MNPTDRIDYARCVIVKPGDVLILSGVTAPPEQLGGAITELAEALGLRKVLVCEDDVQVTVRDVDAELAEAQKSVETYALLVNQHNKLMKKTLDELDEARAELARLRKVS